MTTPEKRGFRLPWGGETRKPDGEADSGPGSAAAAVLSPATDLAPAIAPSSGSSVRSGTMLRRNQVEELGSGPFGLAPADEPDVTGASASLVDVVEPAPKPVRVLAPEPDVAEETPVTASAPGAAPAWPEMDRRGSARHLASDVPPPVRPAVVVESGPKKVNPLVAGLVKAMRDAARAARDETTARMRADAAARAEQIRLEAVAAGTALKKHADEDVVGIREWSRAEMAKVKEQTESRIADRRARLVTDTQAHATATEHLNADLKAAIAAFETEMSEFFDRLLQEDDPGRLATLAERLPEPPTFARLGDAPATRAPRAPRTAGTRKPTDSRPRPAARLAPDAAAAAEAEAILGLDEEATHAAAAHEPSAVGEMAAEPVAEATAPVTFDAPGAHDAPAELAAASPAMDEPAADAAEPAAAREWMPAADGVDHDTNGHVAAVGVAHDETEDADSMAAWTEALAAIRAQTTEMDLPEPEPATMNGHAPSATADEEEGDEPDLGAFDAPADSLLGVLAGASRINSPDDLSPEERIALLGFDEPAPGEEPAPMTVEPVVVPPTEAITRVVVGGLASVAEISAFKSALVGVPGVTSVSVSTGHEGDFVFSVVHSTTTDLRAAVPGFARFAPHLTADEDAVLTYAVGAPGS
jgi:hypothetical protein